MAKQKTWEELELKDDYLFAKVMRNPSICKELIEKLLGIAIEKIEYVEIQKPLDVSLNAKSVRLDVYVLDEKHTVYNVEMQSGDTRELPERSRFYQGIMDLSLLEKGKYYKKLNDSYIIFICTFDLYGKGRHRYTFENVCREDNTVKLGDRTTKIFFNTKGMEDDVSEEVKVFLKYVDGIRCENEFIKKLEYEIEKIKENEEWRQEYIMLLLRDQENIEKGREEGREEGREAERITQIKRLLKKGKNVDDIVDLLDFDKSYVVSIQILLDKHPDMTEDDLAELLYETV